MATHQKAMGHTFDPKLTYRTHIHNISVHAQKLLQIIQALTATGWGNRRRHSWLTKAVMRPVLEYASSISSPLASSTSINKLQVMQNPSLRTATGCTQTYTIYMTKHSHITYTSTHTSMPHITNIKHNIHSIPYTNIQHTSTLQG